MCPFCLGTVGLIVAGAVSTGGLAALAAKVSPKKNGAAEIQPNSDEGENQNVDEAQLKPCGIHGATIPSDLEVDPCQRYDLEGQDG